MRIIPIAGVLLVVEIFACGGGFPALPSLTDTDAAVDAPGDAADDVPVDAGPCNLQKPFAAPVLVAGADLVQGFDYAPTLTGDELTLLYSSVRADASAFTQLYAATRSSTSDPFSASALIASVSNGLSNDSDPALSADGLTLYFQSDRGGGLGSGDIYVATRATLVTDFQPPSPVVAVNTAQDDTQPALDADGSLWLASTRGGGLGGYDLYRAAWMGSAFQSPTSVTELNSASDDWSPTLSVDGLTIFFASNRPGGAGNYDIYTATRASMSVPFSAPTPVTELDTPDNELPHWLSHDGCRLYLERSQAATYEIYVATRPE
jgi:Tol biopolymer transport system component